MLHIDYNITMIHLNLIDELSIASEKLHKYLPIFIQCPIFGYQTSLLNVRQKGDLIDKIDGYLKIALSIYVCEVTSPMSPAQKSSLTKTTVVKWKSYSGIQTSGQSYSLSSNLNYIIFLS